MHQQILTSPFRTRQGSRKYAVRCASARPLFIIGRKNTAVSGFRNCADSRTWRRRTRNWKNSLPTWALTNRSYRMCWKKSSEASSKTGDGLQHTLGVQYLHKPLLRFVAAAQKCVLLQGVGTWRWTTAHAHERDSRHKGPLWFLENIYPAPMGRIHGQP